MRESIGRGQVLKLFSFDYDNLMEPRRLTVERIAHAESGFPLAIGTVSPAILSDRGQENIVAIGSRHFPDDVLHVSKWPLSVNVSVLKADLGPDPIDVADLELFAIGEVEPIEAENG